MIKCPLETEEQQNLFKWAESSGIPELEFLFAIPNGGFRNKATAGRLKAEGVKPGVPDICLPIARGRYCSLYIEMKRISGGAVSLEQKAWINRLNDLGHYAVVAKGWIQAKGTIDKYLKLREGENIE